MPSQITNYLEDDEEEVETTTSYEAPVEREKGPDDVQAWRDRWKGRRKMAWIALWAMIVFTVALFALPTDRIEKLADPISWFYMSMSTIVGCYMGMTTWAFVGKKK